VRHLFVSPHPDDAALSCGGLIVQLADAGETVDIVTVFSGSGPGERLTPYQRLALGFGEEHGEHVEASGPASGPADRPATGTADSASVDDGAPTPFAVMSLRRAEDRAYARMAGASIVHLDLPDAVFRDYAGDEQLIGEPRSGDRAPIGELRVLVADLGPDHLYLPLAIGSHVDHRLARRAGLAILSEPGIRSAGSVRLYEDFP
jgi:LmbE family N-acetylglucosaminyl deacetylase